MFSDLIVYYSKSLGCCTAEGDFYSPEEFMKIYPTYERMEFLLMNEKGIEALDEIWEYSLETIKKCLIKV